MSERLYTEAQVREVWHEALRAAMQQHLPDSIVRLYDEERAAFLATLTPVEVRGCRACHGSGMNVQSVAASPPPCPHCKSGVLVTAR